MVKIPPFEVEQWMDEYETTPGVLNIAETCAASVSLDELVSLSETEDQATTTGNKHPGLLALDPSAKLLYGAIRGSEALRRNVASLYGEPLTPDDVLITQGAIGANFLVLYTLVGPGDHVICVYPTYQQLYGVPQSVGAEVSLWELKEENNFVPDPSELEAMIKPNTKMLILNNPNNPTGAPIPDPILKTIISIAQSHNLIILSDEVYRPLFHSLPPSTPSTSTSPSTTSSIATTTTPPPSPITSFNYPNVLLTGSMSKSFSLAGIRLGWVATPSNHLLEKLASARDYTTISVSRLDDQVATFALSPPVRSALLQRNTTLARTNLALLENFVVEKYGSVCSWVKPQAGTTAFIRFSTKRGGGEEGVTPVDDEEFCLDVLAKTKVFFVPGSRCFGGHGRDFKGYVRIGYVCHTEVLVEALEKLGAYVEENLL